MVTLLCLFSHSAGAAKLELVKEDAFLVAEGGNLIIESSGDVWVTVVKNSRVKIAIFANDRAVKELDFKVEQRLNDVKIWTEEKDEGGSLNFNKVAIKYKIEVPEKYNIEIDTSGGDVDISGLAGNIDIETAGGDVDVREIIGQIKVQSAGGDLLFKETKGDIEISSAGGDVHSEDFDGDVNISSMGGDLNLSGSNGKIKISTAGGDVDVLYFGRNKGISISTAGGDVTLEIPQDFEADVVLRAVVGSIESEFDLETNQNNWLPTGSMEGEINGGGAEVTCHTAAGDVTLRRLSS